MPRRRHGRLGAALVMWGLGSLSASAVRGQGVCERGPIFERIEGRGGAHAATITAFADGELLAAWYSYVGPDELHGAAIYTARRAAGAERWDTPVLQIERATASGNPVLYSEGDEVWLFQAVVPGRWSTARIELQRSYDRGQSWTLPRQIDGPMGSNVKYPPFRTTEGELLLPAYDDFWQRALFFVSADGDEWALRASLSATLAHQCIQPSAALLSDGRIFAVLRNVGGGWLWTTTSEDGGRTWARPARAALPNPASASVLLRLRAEPGEEPVDRLVLVYNDSNTARSPLVAAYSADGGRTWGPRRVIAEGRGEYSYPSAVQSPDGRIHVVYTFERRYIEHVEMDREWVAQGERTTAGRRQ